MVEVGSSARVRVIVAVCTYHRNEPLRTLLAACERLAQGLMSSASIGVVVVDDSQEEEARTVAEQFEQSFELGLCYLSAKSGNISVARNMAIEAAAERGDWIAMTDDDCEPSDVWLAALLDTQRSTGCDIATGLMLRRAGTSAPAWLLDQGFLALGEFPFKDGQEMAVAFTNNCLISSKWIRDDKELRFDPALGKIGGEDMVFFKLARAKGMKICFSHAAIVYENQPADRLTFQYQLRRYFWHGNSSYVTQSRTGLSYGRLLVHASMSLLRGASYSPARLMKGKPPHFRLGLALVAEGAGKMAGAFGAKIKHH